jgi:hypothetical protein
VAGAGTATEYLSQRRRAVSAFALSDMPTGPGSRAARRANSTSLTAPNGTTSTAFATDPSIASRLEDDAPHSSAQSATIRFTNSPPASTPATGTNDCNASNVPIGLSIVDGEYSMFEAAAADLPVAVKVRDSAVVATLLTYADSTTTAATGTRVVSCVTGWGTTATPIANIVTHRDDVAGQQALATQKSRDHMTGIGALTPKLISVQFSTNSTCLCSEHRDSLRSSVARMGTSRRWLEPHALEDPVLVPHQMFQRSRHVERDQSHERPDQDRVQNEELLGRVVVGPRPAGCGEAEHPHAGLSLRCAQIARQRHQDHRQAEQGLAERRQGRPAISAR